MIALWIALQAATVAPTVSAGLDGARPVEIRVQSPQGHLMAGEILLPARPEPVPAVLLISGSGRQSRDFAAFGGRYRPHHDLAKALLAAGIAVIRFDERNTGASGGDHRRASAQDLQSDVQLILHRAAEDSRLDRRRLFLFGHSEGAVFAMRLAASDPLVRGIAIAGAPYLSGRALTRQQVEVEVRRKPGQPLADWKAAVDAAYAKEIAYQESRPSLRAMLDYDGRAVAARVGKPALVLEGAEDWQIRPPQGLQLAAAMRGAGNRKVTYRLLTGVGHLLTRNPHGVTDYDKLEDLSVSPQVSDALVDWVRAAAR